MKEPKKWYQGWAKDKKIRRTSSSGGMARIISENFIRSGNVVCTCLFEKGKFVFKLIDNIEELDKCQGSKYVKSNPKEVYKLIQERIKENRKVLFIGLPCQVAAVKRYLGDKYQERLYTIDLICHGTPSAKFFNKFLNEHGISEKNINKVQKINFRGKRGYTIEIDLGVNKSKIEKTGVMDKYSIAFLNAVCYTENCYQCSYARKERCSDITLGDAWGTELNKKGGVSLILCQTNKGIEMISDENIELRDVDIDEAIKNNPQLRKPCEKPKFFEKFFRSIERGKKIDDTVFTYLKYRCVKQTIKKFFIRVF